MVNAQEWLDKVHPKKVRKNIDELDIRDSDLEGELKLEDFDNLKKFCCRGNELTKLIIGNCSGLEDLDCSFNTLTKLNLSRLKKLQRFSGSDNLLSDLNFLSSLEVDKLISLNITNNNLPPQDLSIFSRFVNLKLLWVGNDDEEKIQQDVCNKFHGSLKTLKTLTKLESLNISNTDIDGGLRHLPIDGADYIRIYCFSEQRSGSRVKRIVEKLEKMGFSPIDDEEEYRVDELPIGRLQKIKNKFFRLAREKNYENNNMAKKKIIVLIGRTGQGKSALANVLSGGDTNRKVKILQKKEEKEETKWLWSEWLEGKELKESEGSKSETRSIQMIEFEHKGEIYLIVDSIGIGDTSLSESQVLAEIARGYEIIKDGIHQVLFVNGERFTPEEIETYNLLKEFFFNEEVNKYTTIIRTKFPSFTDEVKCKRDIDLLLAEDNPKITNMINSCNGIIHVDNPSINVTGENERLVEMMNGFNKEIRGGSRDKLLKLFAEWKAKNEEDCKPRASKEIKKQIKSGQKLDAEDFKEFLAFVEQQNKGLKCQIL